MEMRRGARRGEQLLQGYLEGARHPVEDGKGRVGASRLEVGPGRPGDAGELRHLLLGGSAGVAKLLHVRGEMAGERVHANRVAFCQFVVTTANLKAAGRYQ